MDKSIFFAEDNKDSVHVAVQSANRTKIPMEDQSENNGEGHEDTSEEKEKVVKGGSGDTIEDYVTQEEKPSINLKKEENPKRMSSARNMTRAIFLKTLHKTNVEINDVSMANMSLTKLPGNFLNRTLSFLVQLTPKLKIKNKSLKPLKFDDNFTILIAKKKKVLSEKKRQSRKKREAESYESREGEKDYDEENNSKEYDEYHDRESEVTNRPDYEEKDYEEKDESSMQDESGGDSADAYDIHGYREDAHTTHWPPNTHQPAYSLTDGRTPDPKMKSRRPQMFQHVANEYGPGQHQHPGGATSTSNFHMGKDEHHHHHFYHKLKETHENKPKYHVHATKFLIPPEIYRKYPGKHKHFHHVKTPDGKKIIKEESEEDDPHFDPNTLTNKDHEDAYKTYDEEEIAVDENYEESDDPPLPPSHDKNQRRPSAGLRSKKPKPSSESTDEKKSPIVQKHVTRYRIPGKQRSMRGSKHKAEVDRIFNAVEEAMKVKMPSAEPLFNMW